MSISKRKNQKKFLVSILTDDPSGAIMWTTKGAVNRRLALVNSYSKKQLYLSSGGCFFVCVLLRYPVPAGSTQWQHWSRRHRFAEARTKSHVLSVIFPHKQTSFQRKSYEIIIRRKANRLERKEPPTGETCRRIFPYPLWQRPGRIITFHRWNPNNNRRINR